MKRVLKTLAFVAAGCVIGFVLGSLNSFKAISHFASIALTEIAIDVCELQQGRGDSVLERKRNALPVLVQQHESSFRRFLPENQRNNALWAVSQCYEVAGIEPPASIKPILDALPPRPLSGCELKNERGDEETKKGANVEQDAEGDEEH